MKNIFCSDWKYGNVILYLTMLVCFSLIAFYNLSSGFVMSSDSVRFSRWADELINFNFNFNEFFSIDRAYHRPHLFFFSVPVALISLCKVLFVNEWQFAFLLTNLLLVFFSLIIFVKCLLLIGVRPILISLTLPMIVISIDMLTWPRFILSDIIYAFLVLLCVLFVIKIILKKKINYFYIFLIVFLLLGCRPSSIPVIFSIIFFTYCQLFSRTQRK